MSALSIAAYFPFPRVVPVEQHLTTDPLGVVHSQITFTADPRCRPVCSRCGRATRAVHSTSERRVMDLSVAGARTELVIPSAETPLPAVRCPERAPRVPGPLPPHDGPP